MLLGFKQKFPDGTPSHFKEKILAGLYPDGVYAEAGFVPKIHTIRDDPTGLWKPKRSIQFAHGIRSKYLTVWYDSRKGVWDDSRNMNHGDCTSVQQILIRPASREIFVDEAYVSAAKVAALASNDGFDSTEDFFEWFEAMPLKVRRLIHWTDKRY